MTTELAIIENLELVPFFTKGDSVDEILEKIAKETRAHVPDLSTAKTRSEITANITRVTECKTYLEDERKKLADEYKLIPKKIDANGKRVKDFLAGLQKELRQPLTDWEAERKQTKDTEKFLAEFDVSLEAAYLEKENRDLKAAQAEADRVAEVKEAVIKAAAEAKALAELEASNKIAKANQDKLDAEQREEEVKRSAKAFAEQSELNRVAQEKRAKSDAAEAARREKMARWVQYISEAYAHNDKLIATENARQAEVNRQKALQENQRQQEAQRQANKKHCGNVNRVAMDAFIHAGLSQEQAKLAVIAIAKNLIPAVEIKY